MDLKRKPDVGEIRIKARFANELDVALSETGKLAKKKVRTVEAEAVVDTGALTLPAVKMKGLENPLPDLVS